VQQTRRTGGARSKLTVQRVSFRLTLISTRFARFVAPLYANRYKLTRPAWRTLAYIDRAQPLAPKDIGPRIAVDPAMITRAINLLVEKRYISRKVDPDDHRRVILRTTAKGAQVCRAIGELITTYDELLLAPLTPAEKATLGAILEKLEAQIESRFSRNGSPSL
jgi:DNA-binding MarR family transcriptional regulator